MDVTSAMRRAATFFADREAVVHGKDRLTFAAAWERGCRMANGLIALGLEPGERVAVLEDNSKEAADFFLGAGIANLVRVPLYPRNSREAHLHMVGHTGCKALVVGSNYAPEVADFRQQLPDLRHILVRDQGYERWLAAQSPEDPMLRIRPEDNYIIRHTGGTTGRSKGVAYTHKAWLACNRDWFYNYPPVEPGDKCLHVGPISHGSGYLFVPIWVWGGCNVMVDKFEAADVVEIMEREAIAYLFAVPTMVNVLNHEATVRRRDWSKLKCMLIAAAPISDATALTAREIFGDRIYQGYGQTEVLLLSFMGPRQWFAEVEGSTPLRSCGLIMPFADVEIWDEDNKPVSLGPARPDRRPHRRADDRLLERPGGNQAAHGRRLGADRRYRHDRPERLPVSPGPRRRHDHLRRLQHLADGARERHRRSSGGDGGGGVRHPGHALGRDALRRRGAEARWARR